MENIGLIGEGGERGTGRASPRRAYLGHARDDAGVVRLHVELLAVCLLYPDQRHL